MEKLKCVSCTKNETYQRLVHKETGKEYPLCLDCIRDGLYNKEVFNVVMVRGKPIKASKSLLDKLFNRS